MLLSLNFQWRAICEFETIKLLYIWMKITVCKPDCDFFISKEIINWLYIKNFLIFYMKIDKNK